MQLYFMALYASQRSLMVQKGQQHLFCWHQSEQLNSRLW
jgi:hypothetical protein